MVAPARRSARCQKRASGPESGSKLPRADGARLRHSTPNLKVGGQRSPLQAPPPDSVEAGAVATGAVTGARPRGSAVARRWSSVEETDIDMAELDSCSPQTPAETIGGQNRPSANARRMTESRQSLTNRNHGVPLKDVRRAFGTAVAMATHALPNSTFFRRIDSFLHNDH
jgi:hypothetical protein